MWLRDESTSHLLLHPKIAIDIASNRAIGADNVLDLMFDEEVVRVDMPSKGESARQQGGAVSTGASITYCLTRPVEAG